jgi:hypothetical protein
MNNKQNDYYKVSVTLTKLHGKQAIQLRGITTDNTLMKKVISAAYREQPLIILPRFTDKMQATARLLEYKILYKNKRGVLFFVK